MSLQLHDVTLTLGDGDQQVTALDHVGLQVGPGELVAVVGPSGSGKSSLLAVAGGLLRPTGGRVLIGGDDVATLDPRTRARVRQERIGFVFQASNLLPSLTAVEQLELVRHLGGQRPASARARALELLREVGMADRADHRPGQLSGGERQRVGIARALMNQPAIILADEPTSALDSRRSQELVDLLARESHDRGVATLMVTHDTSVLGHVDRVLQMHDGRLHETVPPATPSDGSHAAVAGPGRSAHTVPTG